MNAVVWEAARASGFTSFVLGSVSQYCAAHAGGAVVVVPPA